MKFYLCSPVLLALITILISPLTLQGEEEPQAQSNHEFLWHLEQNRWEINEELGLGYSSTTGSIMELCPSVQYFFFKKLSVGGSMEIIRAGEDKVLGIGPSATYYFFESGPWATYLGQRLGYRFSTPKTWSDSQKTTASTYVGFNYFTTSKMALGGLLASNYSMTGEAEANRTFLRFVISFYY